ncbi:hypothetical protein AB4156_01885 [Cupriavidus sp. 2MCAB6]|uniref:hypothetical protein n=1 Tax=Cupriavidus sp. 2MCAB6 TaxID=3232981 RepID=UPI003F8FFF11
MLYSPEAIHTAALPGNAGCGKTSPVERRTTMCEFDPLDTPDDQSRLNDITGGHDNHTIQLGHYESVPPAPQKPMASQHKSHRDGAA